MDFNIFGDIFEDAETESAIVLHVRLMWVQNKAPKGVKSVSYTHLTLPTIYSV